MIINALSVDVEEYYNGVEFEAAVPACERHRLPSRVESSMSRVLDLLARLSLRATFFIVGEIAKKHPAMVQHIAEGGHEVACHSYRHEPVSRLSPEEFHADVYRAKAILEDLTGKAVVGYRAPYYSIGPEQAWAYDVLLEVGYGYDSSTYPILHDRYGDPTALRFPFEVRSNGHGSLIEFPIGTARLLGMNLPIGGGGFFRLFPTQWIRRGIQRVNVHERQPIMFYFHPWELDPDQPRPPMPWHHRFRHYVNLHLVESKLHCLFGEISFAPAREVLGLSQGNQQAIGSWQLAVSKEH